MRNTYTSFVWCVSQQMSVYSYLCMVLVSPRSSILSKMKNCGVRSPVFYDISELEPFYAELEGPYKEHNHS